MHAALRTALPTFLALVLFAAAPCRAATLPVPEWLRDRESMPGVDGNPSRPMWAGASWNDSVRSTGATALHAMGITGRGVSAAIYDSLFDVNHPRIKNNIVAAYGTTQVGGTLLPLNGDLSGYTLIGPDVAADGVTPVTVYGKEGLDAVAIRPGMVDNENSEHALHGTHTAGTIIGMAPDAGLVLLTGASMVLSVGPIGLDVKSEQNDYILLAKAAEWAAKYNIAAFNGSYGEEPPFAANQSANAAQQYPRVAKGLALMREAGILPVFASGNSGWNNYVNSPSAQDNTVAVGALHAWGMVTSFSNLSARVVLLAPGQDIYSSIPHWIVGGTTGIAGYNIYQGTSMASPHVAGAAVLLKSGARNATGEEIYEALIQTGDVVRYDGDMVLPVEFLNPNLHGGDATLDQWREVIVKNNVSPYLPGTLPLQQTEYRFIRVDKAYRYLTFMRTAGLTGQAMLSGTPYASMLGSFAGELGKYLDKTNADLYQRLDGQSPDVLARAARQLSPAFTATTMESATFGHLDVHKAIGRRLALGRLHPDDEAETAAATDGLICLPDTGQRTTSVWAEGFGGHLRRSETPAASDYDGHFAGATVGLERGFANGFSLGGFAAWSNHRVSGDGRSRGNWGTLGLYAGFARGGWSVDASVSAGAGEYDLRRGVAGPPAAFPGYVYAPARFNADADATAFAATARLAAGYDLPSVNGWRFGLTAEGSVSLMRMGGYDEDGAGGLALSVDRHRYNYGEGGGGVRVSRRFVTGSGRAVVFSTKVLGLYGRSGAEEMTGRFRRGGTPFAVSPERVSGGWLVPEASLSWQATDRTTLTASYQGRFGERTRLNSGFLSVDVTW